MYLRTVLRQYRLHFSVLLFIIIFAFIHWSKPGLVYSKDGSFRKFGVGVRDKTVISMWIVAIVLAILCYVGVSFYAYSV